jgi:hypothetical protein
MNTETKPIKLSEIRIDGGTQTRVKIKKEAVSDYSAALLDGKNLPPVDVFYDGVDHWLADGFHRYHAHKNAGLLDMLATIHEGTLEDALKFALGANRTNGIFRSTEDKRNCVKIALAKWPEWSDRRIAETCGVGHQLVGNLRPDVDESSTPPTTRTDTLGRQQPASKPPRQTEPAPEPETQPEPDEEDMNNDSPTEEVETTLPEVPARLPKVKIDQGRRLWCLAKGHLDKIIKNDVSREAALNEAIEYCRNRIENKI